MTHFKQHACEVSDFHGVKHFAGPGGILRRLIWLLFFLAALGAFIYQTTLLFIYFFQSHHITLVDILFDSPLEFPAITLCNVNKYRESALTEDDIKNVGIHLGIIDEDHNLLFPDLYTDEFKDNLASVNWTDVDEDENYNMTEFLMRTGHQFEEMVIECKWRGENCTAEDFTLVLTHLGNCYTFNKYVPGYERHFSLAAGPSNGLQLMLDIQEDEYTPSNDLDGGAADAGIKFMVHHPTEPPYIKEFGISASPGQHVFASMRHQQITALPAPYTLCEKDGDINYYDHYSLQACRIECETDIVIEACGCKLAEQPGSEQVCGPADTHECAHPELVKAVQGTSDYGTCVCSSPCEAEQYPTMLSNVKLRAAYLETLFQQGTEFEHNASYIESNVIELSIYFEALNYETIEQIPALSVIGLLSSIGGNMGLFIGAGLLTIIQLGEYFIDEALSCCGFKRDNEDDETSGLFGCVKKSKINSEKSQEKMEPTPHAWSTENNKLETVSYR